jgi:uncharacterized protein YdeI (BOF family)
MRLLMISKPFPTRPRQQSHATPPFRRREEWATLCGIFCLAGVIVLAGCGKPKGTVKGTPPKGEPRSVLAVLAGDTPATVTIQGTLLEKCPVAGCWFRLLDGTSVIKVDTKTAGFVVTEIPLETKITVSGRITQEGDETVLNATGLRY